MTMLRIGRTTVVRNGDHTLTILADGGRVEAVPHDTEDYRAHARALGYGDDVAAMSAEHEILHSRLAHLLGLPESPVMRAVADDTWQLDPGGLLALEEAAVLAVARWARAVGGRVR